MRVGIIGGAVFCFSFFAKGAPIATQADAARYLAAFELGGNPLYSEGKIDGLLRGMPFPVEQRILDAIAKNEMTVKRQKPSAPRGWEPAKLARIAAEHPNARLYVEVNLAHSLTEQRGEYLAVFWQTPGQQFKHVFSEYVSAASEGSTTPLGVKSILDCDEFHCSSSYDNALMDFYEMLYLYPDDIGGGIHMTSHLETLGTPDSAGCIRTRLAAAYRLFELRKLVNATGGTVVYNIVDDPARTFAPTRLPPFAVYWMEYANVSDFAGLSDNEKYIALMAITGLADEMQVVTAAQGRHITYTRHGRTVGRTEPASESERKRLYEDYFARWNIKPFTLAELDGT